MTLGKDFGTIYHLQDYKAHKMPTARVRPVQTTGHLGESMQMKGWKRLLLPLAALVVGLGCAGLAIYLARPGDLRPQGTAAAPQEHQDSPHSQGAPPATRIRPTSPAAATPEQRVAKVDQLLHAPDTVIALASAQEIMVMDDDRTVRERAFAVALKLGSRLGATQARAVVRRALGSPFSETRREALRTLALQPDAQMRDDLIAQAQNPSPEQWLAVQALAFLKDETAQRRVLEFARDASAKRYERIRIILLLSRSGLPEAVAYLQELARGDDAELSRAAVEALAASSRR